MHCRSGPRPRLPVSQPRMKVERVVCASLRGALIPANGTIETVPVGSLRAPADRRATTLTGLLRSADTRYTGGVRASERPRYNPTQGPPKKRGRSSLSLGPSGEGPRGQMSAHHGSLRLFARPPARPPVCTLRTNPRALPYRRAHVCARTCAHVHPPNVGARTRTSLLASRPRSRVLRILRGYFWWRPVALVVYRERAALQSPR